MMAEKKKRRKSLKVQIIIGCIVFIAALCLIMSIVSFSIYNNHMIKQLEYQLTGIINMTATRIDTEDLEQCIASGEPSEKFEEMIRYIDDARLYYNLDFLVLVQPVKEGDSYDVIQIASGLLPDERAGLVDNGIPIPELGDRIGAAFTPEFVVHTYNNMMNLTGFDFSTTKNAYGETFGGAYSLRNDKGEGIALITAGVSTASIDAALRDYVLLITLGAVILAGLFLLFISLWARSRVVRPIDAIETAARDFAQKSREQKDPSALVLNMPEFHSNNELETLSETLVTLSVNMKKYVEDIVFSEKEISRIQNIAFKDALTGVNNKAAFGKALQTLNEEIAEGTAEFGIVMADINSLKYINDTFGHARGDDYIRNTCRLLCDTFDHSPVYRFGGDEFIILLKYRDLAEAEELIGQIGREIRKFAEDPSAEPWERVSVALGCAFYDKALDADADTVIRRADDAMYKNKKKMKEDLNRK